jgi:hypothetical protein
MAEGYANQRPKDDINTQEAFWTRKWSVCQPRYVWRRRCRDWCCAHFHFNPAVSDVMTGVNAANWVTSIENK